MDSGSIVPADPIDGPKGQAVYDSVVKTAGCSGASDSLACLRALPYTQFLNAANSVPGFISYHSVALSYLPRPDGVVLTDSPEVLAKNGKFAAVPFIIGDQEDEGTLFALFQSNITTNDELVEYLSTYFFGGATTAQLEALLDTYPQDLGISGSPFRTGVLNNLYPQYKRLAAILGDLVFTLTRRGFWLWHKPPNLPCHPGAICRRTTMAQLILGLSTQVTSYRSSSVHTQITRPLAFGPITTTFSTIWILMWGMATTRTGQSGRTLAEAIDWRGSTQHLRRVL